MNHELPNVQAVLRKGRGTRDQSSSIPWIIRKGREFHKNIYLCLIDYTKAFDCVEHNKLSTILQEMGIPEHLTCLLRNLYASCKSVEACGVTLGGGSFWGKPGGQQSVTALSPVRWAPQSASGRVVALACSMATPVGMLLEHVTVRPEGGRGLARVGGLPCVSLAVRGSENALRRALEPLS